MVKVICRQMMRWIDADDIGDTGFLPEEIVDKFKFHDEKRSCGGRRWSSGNGQADPLGITKASLSTDSFTSAAYLQETARVLTEAPGRTPPPNNLPNYSSKKGRGENLGLSLPKSSAIR